MNEVENVTRMKWSRYCTLPNFVVAIIGGLFGDPIGRFIIGPSGWTDVTSFTGVLIFIVLVTAILALIVGFKWKVDPIAVVLPVGSFTGMCLYRGSPAAIEIAVFLGVLLAII